MANDETPAPPKADATPEAPNASETPAPSAPAPRPPRAAVATDEPTAASGSSGGDYKYLEDRAAKRRSDAAPPAAAPSA